jgi:hypothetical protein
MVSLSYHDAPIGLSTRRTSRAYSAAARLNWRLLFALGLNVVLWAGMGVVLRLAF